MSTLWTPSGERPVGPDAPSPGPSAPAGPPPAGDEAAPSDEELRAQIAEVQRELAETPASVVVTNHCIGLFQLGALHLNQQPPNLGEAQLAIDAMGAIVETLGPRLGQEYEALQEALTSIRLAFVQAQNA